MNQLAKKKMQIITEAVCEVMGVTTEEIRCKSRKGNYPIARKLISYFARQYTNLSSPQIADLINRDHATVLYHKKYIVNMIETRDRKYLPYINSCRKLLEDRLENISASTDQEFIYMANLSLKEKMQSFRDHVESDRTMEGFRKRLMLEDIDRIEKNVRLVLE